MVAGFVHQSGGELNIKSVPGKGTIVDLILPATEAKATARTSAEEANLKWLAQKRLMLIDEAIRRARAFEPFGLAWLEEPLPAEDLAGRLSRDRSGCSPDPPFPP